MVQSVQKALHILQCLSDRDGEPVRLMEIAGSVGINKATASRLLDTLVLEGFAERVSWSKGYVLGPVAYCLPRLNRYEEPLVRICRPVMQYINSLGETCSLSVIRNNKKYIIDHVDKSNFYPYRFKIINDKLYDSTTGKVLLANMTEKELYTIFYENTRASKKDPKMPEDFEELKRSLRSVSPRGVFREESFFPKWNMYMISYAAALYQNGKCVAAIGIVRRVHKEQYEAYAVQDKQLIKVLRMCADEINRRMQFNDSLLETKKDDAGR